jgi:hypothetical protein
MLLRYYTMPQLYEAYVETFNKRPNQFDYHGYLRHMKDSINILDKKSEMRAGAYSSEGLIKGATGGAGGISTLGSSNGDTDRSII